MIFETNSAEETFDMGFQLGKKVRAGDIICIEGDLGVGKTVFAQGFAKGLGITQTIDSPTYTIMKIYDGGRAPLYHFDVYRLGSVEEMDDIGYEEYFFGEGVCLIEWAGKINRLLPDSSVRIRISRSLVKDYDYRKIEVTGNIRYFEEEDSEKK